jgi:selenocysteine lyase/cysteine desulfurase
MDRHLEYLRDFHSNPSFQNRDKYVPMRERLRAKTAKLLGVTPEEIAFTRNTSEGSNTIVQGLDLKPGDEVILTAHNHPSNLDSWQVRAKRVGFTVKVVPVGVPATSVSALLESIKGAMTKQTRVISVTHVTSTTGIRYPAREIGQLARSNGVYFHLDGAQSMGALDFNLREIGCDSYAASAHKWPMGPLEAGILYVRQENIGKVWPSIVTAGWSDTVKGARKFEVYGQRDDPRVAALEAAIDFLDLIGMARIEKRLMELTTHAKSELKKIPGVQLKTNTEPDLSGGVIKFKIAGHNTAEAYNALWTKHRLAIASTPAGDSEGLRFSPHVYNSHEEIERAVAAVKAMA